MTGGIVAVLGRAGRNFGAGMSNGLAYVLDEAGTFQSRINGELIELGELDGVDLELLHRLLREHEEKTVSARARIILAQWEEFVSRFRKVTPRNGAAPVESLRIRYLESETPEREADLARRSA
jgi:glutamate synthase domain-containing protein 3